VKGELHVVASVPDAFASFVDDRLAAHRAAGRGTFRLGASGGASGTAAFTALSARANDLSDLALYFVDERCVSADDPDSNQKMLRGALGERVEELAGFFPMSCEAGAESYDALLKAAGHLHLCQLGLGPDGHTASLFPGSPALFAPADRFVVENEDPSGSNVHPRLTLTYSAIETFEALVFTVIGADKQAALSGIDAGGDLPAARLDGPEVTWLCDAAAAGGLSR
jgi:6-phosphogluconolactonase